MIMATVETTLTQRTFVADVHLDLSHAPWIRVHLTARAPMDLVAEKIQITYRKEGETGEWETWSWWLRGTYWQDGKFRPDFGPAQVSREELNRWDRDSMTPDWVAEIVEGQRLELIRIGA
uniref:hypothetical protein n=1 Tax=Nonomuraea sp. CA-251285 TaxID=3240002 RepID=UPI003F4929AD